MIARSGPISAREFVERLRAGHALFEDAVVTGRVCLKGVTLQGGFSLVGLTFEGEFDASDARVPGDAVFVDCLFVRGLTLRNAEIDGTLSVTGVKMLSSEQAWHRGAHADGPYQEDLTPPRSCDGEDFILCNLTCRSDLVVTRSLIDGMIDASGMVVDGDTRLSGVSVRGGPIRMTGARFSGNLTLAAYLADPTNPTSLVHFSCVGLMLDSARVEGRLIMSGLKVRGCVDAVGLRAELVQIIPESWIDNGVARTASRPTMTQLILSGAKVANFLQLRGVDVELDITAYALDCGPMNIGLSEDGDPSSIGGLFIIGATIRGWLSIPLLRVTGKAVDLSGFRGLQVDDSQIHGDLIFTWVAKDLPHGRYPGAVIARDTSLTQTVIGGDIDMSSGDFGGRLLLSHLQAGSLSFQAQEPDTPRARATTLDLSGATLRNELDLRGLDLLKSDQEDASPGVLHAPALRCGDVYLAAQEGQPSHSVHRTGLANFTGAQISSLHVSGETFRGVGREEERSGLILAAAVIGELVMPAGVGAASFDFPVPIDFSDVSVRTWNLAGARRPHVDAFEALLACETRFSRATYQTVERHLRDRAQEDEANRVFRLMERRAAVERYRAGGPLALPVWLASCVYDLLLGFGTAPQRLFAIIALLWILAMPVYAARVNIEPTLIARMQGVTLVTPAQDWGRALALSLRNHLPVVNVSGRDQFELRDEGETRWTIGRLSFSLPITPEDLGLVITILNWIMWPVVLAFALRKAFRP